MPSNGTKNCETGRIRWQRASVSDEEFLAITGRIASHKDPHGGFEGMLLAHGSKPMAYIMTGYIEPRWYPACIVEPFHHRGLPRWLIVRPEHYYRVAAWRRTYSMFDRGLLSRWIADARCGILLGYTKKQIRAFCGRADGMR